MSEDDYGLLPCQCCGEADCDPEEYYEDPDLGAVCEDCMWRLKAVRNDLYTISQQEEKS